MRLGGEGFDAFLAAEIPRLMGLAFRLSHDEHESWDLVQETLVRVGLRWSRIDRERDPHAYATTVLVRLHWRRSRRRQRESAVDVMPESAVAPDLASEHADEVERLLSPLAPRQRAVMVLRYCYDMPLADIADAIGCSLGTVKSQHARALQRLRTAHGANPTSTNTSQLPS
jgi:RNA polymerase sigma-70 factor (sigma-E family)